MTKYIYTFTHIMRYALLVFAMLASVVLVSLSGSAVRTIVSVEPIYLQRLFASIIVAFLLYKVECWTEHFLHDKF